MALKGETVIELTDVNTGAVEVHRDTNMVTNALQEIIKPVGYIKDGAYLMGFGNQSSPFNRFYWNALGGILLFDNALPETADTLFPPDGTSLTACGSRSMTNSSTTNKCRGNYNSSESLFTESERKMKFVYDFPTDKGNGQISSVALTSYVGGLTGWGHPTTGDVTSAGIPSCCFSTGNGNNFKNVYHKRYSMATDTLFLIDPENDISYLIRITSSTNVVITRRNMNVKKFSIFLNSYSQHPLIDTTNLELSIGFSSTSNGFYMNYDNKTKSLYVLLTNTEIKSGSNFSVLKIEIPSLNYNIITLNNSSGKSLQYTTVAFSGEFMYVLSKYSNDYKSNMYKININTNLMECINENFSSPNSQYPYFYAQLGDRLLFIQLMYNTKYNYTGTSWSSEYDDYYIFVLNNNNLLRTELRPNHSEKSIELIPVLNNPLLFLSTNTYASDNESRYVIISNYLATINNLTTPVYKTADTTMKVTYTIQETNYM